MTTKTAAFRLVFASTLIACGCAVSCAGDDTLTELPIFDGGFEASSFEAGADASPALDAAVDAATLIDAGIDAAVRDSGSDSGLHVVDAGTDSGVDSGSDASTDAGDDSGADSGSDSGLDGGDASTVSVVNGCTTFVDDSDVTAVRVVQGPLGSGPVQYSPNCMSIKAGQSVTFQEGDFSNHPLEPVGGDTPSPIMPTAVGTTVTFAFPNAGTFGFQCEFHPAIMFGAINVVP